ncbi:28400_t:CDS:2, partial [Gigaspora margarita]
CRSCKASKNNLTDVSFDIYSNGRYHQITNQEFQNIREQLTNAARSQLCSQYGLWLSPGPLDPILHDRHQHTPQDVYHAIAGKVARFLDCTCLILTSQGENNLIKHWKYFKVPAKWSRLPNPISHSHSFMMSDFLPWVISAKVSKKVFSLVIDRQDGYVQLQKALDEELNILVN